MHRPDGHRDRGFTLIELLVVVIVIGVLAAIAIPVFLNQRQKAVDASLKADVKNAAQAIETWLVDNPGQPGTSNPTDLSANGFKATAGNDVWVALNPTRGGYCVVARSPQDSTGGALDGVTFDSLSGGLLDGGRSVVHAAAMPGACGLGNTGGVQVG